MFKYLKTIGTVCLLTFIVVATPAAFAQQFPEGGNEWYIMFWSEKRMKVMDTNKDGRVSRQEFMTYMATQFDRMDQDKDSMLTAREFMDKRMMLSTFPTGGSPE